MRLQVSRTLTLPYTGRLFVYCLLFMGRFKFTPLRRFTQLLGWSPKNAGQHQLKNGDVRRLLDFQPVAPGCVFQVFLWITVQNQICIAQWVIVNKVIQLRLLRHGHIQRILDPGAIDGNLSPIPEQQLHAAGVHVEMASSCIVLHVRVLSALRHLYSCDFCDTSFLIRFWTHSRREGAFILLSEENKKSEPFSYREKIRIFMVWCTSRDSNPGPTD